MSLSVIFDNGGFASKLKTTIQRYLLDTMRHLINELFLIYL